MRILICLVICGMVALFSPSANAAVVFSVDVNSNASPTATGFTGLNANGNGSSVLISGTTFTVFSADGQSNTGTPNALTQDFIFDDEPNNAAVGLTVTGLPSGTWQAEVWSWDSNGLGTQIVGIANFLGGTAIDGNSISGGPTIYTTSFAPNPNNPFVFTFNTSEVIDGFGIFTRENNVDNRAVFNALRLTQVQSVPEPSSLLAFTGLALSFGLVGWRKRRKQFAI